MRSDATHRAPDAAVLVRVLDQLRDANLALDGRRGAVLTPADAREVVVTGDLHGNRGNFGVIARRADLAHHPHRHLIVQEVLHGGPRDDTGAGQSHLLLVDIVRLACSCPGRVHILMGNHEMSEWTGHHVQKDGENLSTVFRMGLARSYGDQADAVSHAVRGLCGSLPLVVRLPDCVAVTHSMPRASRLDGVSPDVLDMGLTRIACRKGQLAFDLVWGRLARASDAEAFARWLGVDWVVTGHEPCAEGYALPHPHHVMLESSGWPAAFLMLPTDHPLTPDQMQAAVKLI